MEEQDYGGLESEEKNLKVNAVLDREPVQLFEDRSDVMGGWGSGDNTGSRKRKCAIKDDTQSLDLRERRDYGVE